MLTTHCALETVEEESQKNPRRVHKVMGWRLQLGVSPADRLMRRWSRRLFERVEERKRRMWISKCSNNEKDKIHKSSVLWGFPWSFAGPKRSSSKSTEQPWLPSHLCQLRKPLIFSNASSVIAREAKGNRVRDRGTAQSCWNGCKVKGKCDKRNTYHKTNLTNGQWRSKNDPGRIRRNPIEKRVFVLKNVKTTPKFQKSKASNWTVRQRTLRKPVRLSK